MLTPLHVYFTQVIVNIYLCKCQRPVILIFLYANIYPGSLVVGYHTFGTTCWQCSPPTMCHSLQKAKEAKAMLDHGLWEQDKASTATSYICDAGAIKMHSGNFSDTFWRIYLAWKAQSFPKLFAGMKCLRYESTVLGILHWAVQTAKGELLLNSSCFPDYNWKWFWRKVHLAHKRTPNIIQVFYKASYLVI